MQEIEFTSPPKPGQACKFVFVEDGISREGILAMTEAGLKAFENRCRHLPLPLDYGDGQFMDPSGQWLTCQTHGAMYEPTTGKCVEGPCRGASLRALPLEEKEGRLFINTEG